MVNDMGEIKKGDLIEITSVERGKPSEPENPCDDCEVVAKLQAELKELKRIALKCLKLQSETGKGLPCVTSKSGIQCSDIFTAIDEFKQALKGDD